MRHHMHVHTRLARSSVCTRTRGGHMQNDQKMLFIAIFIRDDVERMCVCPVRACVRACVHRAHG